MVIFEMENSSINVGIAFISYHIAVFFLSTHIILLFNHFGLDRLILTNYLEYAFLMY